MKIPEIKPIDGFDSYFVSEIGEVYTVKPQNGQMYKKGFIRGIMHEIAPFENDRGYLIIKLSNPDHRYHKRVHRLVAEAFIPNPNNYPVVNHKDGNILNNDVDNLEWCTSQYNTNHAFKNLGVGSCKKVKLTELQTNQEIIFYSIRECERYLNLTHGYLSRLLSGEINKWKYNDLYKVEFLE